jgi:hypothetical protein
VCGGYRWCSQPSPAGWKYSPCAGVIGRVSTVPAGWKYSPACGGYRRYLTSSRWHRRIPPHAGVMAQRLLYSPACGGYRRRKLAVFPLRGYRLKTSLSIPPHGPRAGVIGRNDLHECIPPVAGVIGEINPCGVFPRMRGLSVNMAFKKVFPRMRGLSAVTQVGIPPHAGVIGTI